MLLNFYMLWYTPVSIVIIYKNLILCFVDRPSLYNLVSKDSYVHNFS